MLIMVPANAVAECVSLGKPFEGSRATSVFAGTLLKREVVSRFDPTAVDPVSVGNEEQSKYLNTDFALGMRLTFDVRQVWRGPRQRTLVVYQILNPDSQRTWEKDTTYVISASRLAKDEWSRLLRFDGGEDGFVIADCSTYRYTPDIETHLRRAFGKGWRPAAQ